MSFAETLLPEFDDEMSRTRAVLSAVPKSSLDWRPSEDLRTIGWNANHLADIVSWTSDILDQAEFDIKPVDGPEHETPTLADPEQILAAFDDKLSVARAALAAATDDKFAEDWTMKMGGQTLFTMQKGPCIRKWVMNHSIHHRGILSVYLRMNNITLTPVYDG